MLEKLDKEELIQIIQKLQKENINSNLKTLEKLVNYVLHYVKMTN